MRNKIVIILVIITLLAWSYILLVPSFQIDNNHSLRGTRKTLTQISQEASSSVVSIIIKTQMDIYRSNPYNFFEQIVWQTDIESGLWSGFFVSSDWYIITSKHVIDDSDAEYIVVLQSGEQYSSEVAYLSDNEDIALIKINSDSQIFKPLEIQSSKNIIETWGSVIAIWNTLSENAHSVSFGIVSGINWLLETDVVLLPWNSWGPLISSNWKVIGINTAIDMLRDNAWLATQIDSEMVEIYLSSVK